VPTQEIIKLYPDQATSANKVQTAANTCTYVRDRSFWIFKSLIGVEKHRNVFVFRPVTDAQKVVSIIIDLSVFQQNGTLYLIRTRLLKF